MKGISVLSGGMDSAVAVLEARAQGIEVTQAIHFQYGSKHNWREREAVGDVARALRLDLKIVEMPFIAELFKSDLLTTGGEVPEGHYADENMRRTVVPFRNGIMLAIAAGFAESVEADVVILGNHVGDHAVYPDCRREFTEAMGSATMLGTYRGIRLSSPLGHMTKAEIAARGAVLAAPFELTWSCYKGGAWHCGRCGTCVERIEAFQGLKDPTNYEDTEYALAVLKKANGEVLVAETGE